MSSTTETTLVFANGEEKSIGDVLERMETSERDLIKMLNKIITNCIEVCDICSDKIRDLIEHREDSQYQF